MTDLLDDLITFFEARNTGNATNEFLNRCKEEKKKQLLIHGVVKSFYCYDKTVANAEEDYDFRQCGKQCEKCKAI